MKDLTEGKGRTPGANKDVNTGEGSNLKVGPDIKSRIDYLSDVHSFITHH